MTSHQQRHLSRIVAEAGAWIAAKYRRGALEHGGNLWEKSAAEVLEDAGWLQDLTSATGPVGGRPANRYLVNPKVWL